MEHVYKSYYLTIHEVKTETTSTHIRPANKKER